MQSIKRALLGHSDDKTEPQVALVVPISTTPPFVLLALAVLQGISVEWDFDSGEKGEPRYGSAVGEAAVRAALEENVPGKEVRLTSSENILRGSERSLIPCNSSRFPYHLCLHYSSRGARSRMSRRSLMLWMTT